MNCRDWEERIAGDLEDPAVVSHVADCAGCQVFASGLRESLELLREAHADPIPAAAFTAVRARVMAELRPRRRWGWVWAVVPVASVVVALVVGVQERMRVAELPAVALRTPGVVEPRPWVVAAVPRVTPRAPRAHRTTEEVVMKIETADPDVVIYWIAETKGDE